jgi:hypothetical protein
VTPTWSVHAHEAVRCARKDTRSFVVSIVRYVARLSATIQGSTHSKPRRTP